MDTAGITFPDSTHQTTAVNPTAVVHVAGISADGGITAGSGKIGRITFDDNAIRLVNGGSVINTSGAWTYYGTSELGLFPNGSSTQGLAITAARTKAFQVIHAVGGISADAGITFADGTHQTTAASASSGGSDFVSSHNILLEYPDNKEYSLDGYTVAARTYNIFYGRSATGGCTADLIVGGTTLASIAVGPTGASATFSTVVAKESEISVVIIGVTTGVFLEDVRLVAGYTQ
jgi:hypothetical protein